MIITSESLVSVHLINHIPLVC